MFYKTGKSGKCLVIDFAVPILTDEKNLQKGASDMLKMSNIFGRPAAWS